MERARLRCELLSSSSAGRPYAGGGRTPSQNYPPGDATGSPSLVASCRSATARGQNSTIVGPSTRGARRLTKDRGGAIAAAVGNTELSAPAAGHHPPARSHQRRTLAGEAAIGCPDDTAA